MTGPWSPNAERLVAEGAVDGLVLNYARGFQASDLEFLRPWPLRQLLVLDRGLRDLAPIGRLGETLESLSIEGAPGVPVDLGALPNLRWIGASWAIVEASFHRPAALAEAILVEYDARDLAPLATQPTLRKLEINVAPLLESIDGLDAFDRIERLQIAAARELADLAAITSGATSLTEFEVQSCLAVDAVDDLAALHELRLLGVNDCGRIETIGPVEALKELRVFLAWGSTRVIDNDLSPLLALPNLIELRMRDRVTYRPRVSEIQTLIAART